ncbi:uncharacterized protein [Eurosta solidaginis]|uniref:uncharacterized protein n=1 Tax=Eurosta solidaginis TaxID=178769 RepID=UPI0035311F2A
MADLNKHTSALQAIRRVGEFVRGPSFDRADLIMVNARLERLEEQWVRFNAIHEEIIGSIAASNMAEIEIEHAMELAEEVYFSTKSALKRKIEELCPQERAASIGTGEQQPINVQVNVPYHQHDLKNTWGEFDGNILKWQGFGDRFVAAIHNNEQIAPAYKFAYLKKSMTGKAARTLGEWQLTDGNYYEAWERLNQLYNKKYPICREHLRQFIRLPVLQGNPRADELQKMSNVTHETLRQLRAQGLPVEHWDMFIVHMLHERLDPETGKQWELQRKNDTPTTQEMLEFLDRQAAASVGPSERRFRGLEIGTSRQAGPQRDRSIGMQPSTSDRARKPGKTFPCEACGSDRHQLFECSDFRLLSLRARKDLVQRRNLCENCLKKGHKVNQCYQGGCMRCPGKPFHNSTLCPSGEMAKPVLSLQERDERKGESKKTTTQGGRTVKYKRDDGSAPA